ncbi:MAG: hypothetical protein ACI8X5_002534 [Planctomycetota bacterium]|jgi:uncharacterized protein YllA (UPF0747 family)
MTPSRFRIEYLRADIHGLSALEREALAGKLKKQSVARSLEDIEEIGDEYLLAERAQLAKWLEAQATKVGPHVAVLDSIRSLAEKGTACVVCFAEPALATGPQSTLMNVLHTVKVARDLSTKWKRRVVPIIWVQTDQHDSTQLEQACVLNRSYELQQVRLDGVVRGRKALWDVAVHAQRHGLGSLRAALHQMYGDYEYIDLALDILLPREGESLARAFTRGMYELLGKHGLVVIESDAMCEEVSSAMAQVVGAKFIEQLQRTDNELANIDLLYHSTQEGRLPLVSGGDGYRYRNEPGSRTRTELAAEIVQEPNAWSPGNMMRPLVRDLVLPVVAAVGDGHALACHISAAPLHATHGRSTPAFIRSARLTLIDEEVRAALSREKISLETVLHGLGTWRADAQGYSEPDLLGELKLIATRARKELTTLKPKIIAVDPDLKTPIKASSRELERVLADLGQRIQRAVANRDGKQERRTRCLNQSLCPSSLPQGEVFGPLSWIARHGAGWIDELLEELDPFCTEHLALHLF